LKRIVATITLASSGVKLKVISCFCLGPKVPRRVFVNDLLNKTWKWRLTSEGRYGEWALICLDFVSDNATAHTRVLDGESTGSCLVDTTIAKIYALRRHCICNSCWSRLDLGLAWVITHS
jgi:hypothetical protein